MTPACGGFFICKKRYSDLPNGERAWFLEREVGFFCALAVVRARILIALLGTHYERKDFLNAEKNKENKTNR